MAINLAFIDFVVPISTIKQKYPDGLERFIYDHRRSLGGVNYFDEHLFHTGAMSGDGITRLKDKWTALGFEETEVVDGKEHWKDFCVLESLLSRTSRPCPWLMVDEYERIGYLAGTDSGPVVGRRLFERRKSTEEKAKYERDRRRMRWVAILIYRLRHVSPVLVNRMTKWLIRQM